MPQDRLQGGTAREARERLSRPIFPHAEPDMAGLRNFACGMTPEIDVGSDCRGGRGAPVSVTAADAIRLEGRPLPCWLETAIPFSLRFCADTVQAAESARTACGKPWTCRHGRPGLSNTKQGARIYGLGESLGAAVLIEALPVEPRLRAMVAESAYSSFQRRGEGADQSRGPVVDPLGDRSLFGSRAGPSRVRLWSGFKKRLAARGAPSRPRAGSADSWHGRPGDLAWEFGASCARKSAKYGTGWFRARGILWPGRRRRRSSSRRVTEWFQSD